MRGIDSALSGYRGKEGENGTLTCYYVHMNDYRLSPEQTQETIEGLSCLYRVMQEMLEQPPSAEKAAVGRQFIAIVGVLEEILSAQVEIELSER